VRFAIRLFRESLRPAIRRSSRKRTLIIGNDDAGNIALRLLMNNEFDLAACRTLTDTRQS